MPEVEGRQPCLHCKAPTLGTFFPPGHRRVWVCFRESCIEKAWRLYDAAEGDEGSGDGDGEKF